MGLARIMIRLLWISNYCVEVGRGPMNRLINMMESMSEICELSLFSFGPYDTSIKEYAGSLNIKCYESECIIDGWRVINANEVAQRVVEVCDENKIDLVVLTWEIWDLAVAFYNALKDTNIGFLTVLHSIPFAGMPEKSTLFELDAYRRVFNENQWKIKDYLLKNIFSARYYMKKISFLTMTPTVENRLNTYFKNVNLYCAYPGYSVCDYSTDLFNNEYQYDLAFMARFEKGKGIYDLIKIVDQLKKKISNIKLLMIGSFTFSEEKKKYMELLKKHGLISNFVFVGWNDGENKFKYLQSAKLFIYPSFSGDTFSISFLEALSIGKKIVCYNVPYVEYNYCYLDDVYSVKPHDIFAFSSVCFNLLKSNSFNSESNKEFVKSNYSNWLDVSRSEFECYQKYLVERKKINNLMR